MSYQSDFHTALYNRLVYWGVFNNAGRLADMGLAQAQVESDDFSSNPFKNIGNCIGYGYDLKSMWQNGKKMDTTDDVGVLGGYDNIENCAYELADWIHRRYQDFVNIGTVDDYANAMSKNGYMTESPAVYSKNMNRYYLATNVLGIYVKTAWIYVIAGVTVAGAVTAYFLLKKR